MPSFNDISSTSTQGSPPLSNLHKHNKQANNNMGLFWSKGVGGRHFGTSVHVDKHGVRRGPWRFSLGKFSCFRR
nr:hypothetical protein FVER53263_20961 [Fusarium verticillioides]